MRALEYPDEVTGVLSFDFDGTLIIPDAEVPLDPVFFEEIKRLRADGWLWGINTGRSLLQMLEGFNEGSFPFLPDFLIAREREIYTPGDFGRWHPIADWQKKCAKDHKLFFRKAKKFLNLAQKFVEEETHAQWVDQEGDPAGVISTTVEEMAVIVDWIERNRGMCELIGYLRNTIYLRFSHIDYHKGSSLREIARIADIPVEKVFAIGDGHNDLDKLHPDVAGMIACVGNADQEVKDYVGSHSGYVAKAHGSLGSVEALRYFMR